MKDASIDATHYRKLVCSMANLVPHISGSPTVPGGDGDLPLFFWEGRDDWDDPDNSLHHHTYNGYSAFDDLPHADDFPDDYPLYRSSYFDGFYDDYGPDRWDRKFPYVDPEDYPLYTPASEEAEGLEYRNFLNRYLYADEYEPGDGAIDTCEADPKGFENRFPWTVREDHRVEHRTQALYTNEVSNDFKAMWYEAVDAEAPYADEENEYDSYDDDAWVTLLPDPPLWATPCPPHAGKAKRSNRRRTNAKFKGNRDHSHWNRDYKRMGAQDWERNNRRSLNNYLRSL